MSYASTVLADSPVLYLKLTETSSTFADSTGNGHTGTFTNGTRGQQALNPDAGAASVLTSGSNTCCSIPNSAAIPQSTALTLECLCQFTSVPTGTNSAHMWSYNPSSGWGAGVQGSGKGLFTLFGVADYTATWTTITTGKIYHLVWATTGNGGTVTFYQNGTATSSVTIGTEASTSGALLIGSESGGSAPYTGYISDIAVYAATLNQTQVTAHYQASLFPASSPTFVPSRMPRGC